MTATDLPGEPSSRFADIAAQAFEAIHHKLAPHRAKLRDQAISEWLEGHEADAVALARQVIADVAEHPDMPPEAKPVFDLMLRPEHQTQAILTVLGIYPIVNAFVSAAVQPFVQDVANTAWAVHPSMPISPAEIALGVLRNNPHIGDEYHEAAKSGADRGVLDALIYNTGEPPGLMQLLELFRRGELTEDRLRTGVRQSRVRDEWFDAVLALRFAPPSPIEALTGALKGHLDDAASRALFAQGGIDPKHYEWMLASAGRPPGAGEMLQLVNRGLLSEDDFGQAVRQSDIQNRWIPQLLETRRYLPPVRSIVSMVRHNAIPDDKARTLLTWHGVFPEDVDLFLAEGHATKTAAHKEIALGTVKTMYADGLKTNDEAVQAIVALGYTGDQAAEIVALVDEQAVQRYRNTAISHVHTLFVHHKIVQNEASNKLDALHVRHAVRDELIKVWIIERQINIVPLTLAQVQGAWRRGVMDDEEFANRVRALGHPDSDIPFLKALAFPPSAFKGGPSVADI